MYCLNAYAQYRLVKVNREFINSTTDILRRLHINTYGEITSPSFSHFLNPYNWLIVAYKISLIVEGSDHLRIFQWCEENVEYLYVYEVIHNCIIFQSKEDAVKFILRWGSEVNGSQKMEQMI